MVYSNLRSKEKVLWYHKVIVQVVSIIVFAAATVILSNAYFTYQFTFQTLEDEYTQSENTSFIQTLHEIDQTILDNILHFATLSSSHTPKHFFTEIRDTGTSISHPSTSVLEDMHNFIGNDEIWKRIDFIDNEGTVRISTATGLLGSKIDISDLVQSDLKHTQIGTMNVYDIGTYQDIGTALLVISEIHVWNNLTTHSETEIVGYAIGYLSPEAIFRTTETYTKNHSDTLKPLVILREDGTMLFQNTKDIPSTLQATIQSPPGTDIDMFTENVPDDTDQKYILHSLSQGYGTFSGFSWHVLTEIDTSSVQQKLVTDSLGHIKYYIPAVAFAAAICFFYVFYFLVSPLSSINKHIELSIATGKANPLSIKNRSEIGILANAYNTLIAQIEDRTVKLTNTLEKVQGLNRDLENTKTAALNVLEDLDEEKKKVDETVKIRTQELVSERQKLMHITENMFVGVILTDEDGKPVFVNKQGKEILGIKDAISNALVVLREKFPSPEITALIKAYIQGKSSIIKEIENEDGIFEIMGRCSSQQKNTDHDFFGKGIWIRNITDEKQLERSKSELVAVASHQLRTPLTVARGNLEMLLDGSFGKVTKKQRELLADSQESVIRLISMVNDMLDITKIEKGDKKVILGEINILEPIQMVVDSFETYTERYKYSITLEKPSKEIIVRGDKALIVQVFQNLIDNALKYGKDNRNVTISFKTLETHVEIYVVDNGIGIPSKELSTIYQRFYRASNAVRSTAGGSGLGLFIVKSFVEQMKGSIAVTSSEGVGTTFVVSLPLANIV
ncbi:MAG: Integral membrane sensor signal transduction histidine kinase [Parcubacteria group bacterium GW2011_GWA2_43_11]|nr:MAG: Integral membrane sensor signal transduction histidine kinase [Parcubacteria group bacterium GW2011_GWA2_43_11]